MVLPERYGSWKTVYSRFRSWIASGLFERLFQKLSDTPDMENLSLDSTVVRAHQKATGAQKNAHCLTENQAIGLSRGGRTTKIHAAVNRRSGS